METRDFPVDVRTLLLIYFRFFSIFQLAFYRNNLLLLFLNVNLSSEICFFYKKLQVYKPTDSLVSYTKHIPQHNDSLWLFRVSIVNIRGRCHSTRWIRLAQSVSTVEPKKILKCFVKTPNRSVCPVRIFEFLVCVENFSLIFYRASTILCKIS